MAPPRDIGGMTDHLVPIARPTCCLTRLWSPIPNHGFAVPGLLILALPKRNRRKWEQSTENQNQSKLQGNLHKPERDVTAWCTSGKRVSDD